MTTLNVVTRNPIIIIVESVDIGRIIYQYIIHRYNNSYTVLWYQVPGTRGPHCRKQQQKQQQIISDFTTINMSSNPHFTNMAHICTISTILWNLSNQLAKIIYSKASALCSMVLLHLPGVPRFDIQLLLFI